MIFFGSYHGILEAGETPALCLSNRDFYEAGKRRQPLGNRPGKASAEVLRIKSGNSASSIHRLLRWDGDFCRV